MRTYKYKIDKERKWLEANTWGIPAGVADLHQDQSRRTSRKPLSPELERARASHMHRLVTEGATYALVGKLYKLHRSRVRDIVNTYIASLG